MLMKTILCGVLSCVAISPLVVNADTAKSSSAENELSDTAITAKIKARYLMSPIIKMLYIVL